MITTRSSLTLLLMMLVCGLTQSCDQRQSTVEGVVASVNGTPITQEDLAFATRGTSGAHQLAPSMDKKTALEGIVLQELAYQQAVKLGLDADPKYQAELHGMEVQINAFKRRKLSEMFLQQELLKNINVSDAEAQQYFNEHATQLRTEINVWQILRRDENAINSIHAELAQGSPFETVVAKLFPSTLLNAERKPWDMGYLPGEQIPEPWRNAVNTLQVGETSDIIRGPNNRFWIIKLIDRRENTDLTFEQIKPKIIDILKHEKAQSLRKETIQDLRNKARIVYSK